MARCKPVQIPSGTYRLGWLKFTVGAWDSAPPCSSDRASCALSSVFHSCKDAFSFAGARASLSVQWHRVAVEITHPAAAAEHVDRITVAVLRSANDARFFHVIGELDLTAWVVIGCCQSQCCWLGALKVQDRKYRTGNWRTERGDMAGWSPPWNTAMGQIWHKVAIPVS